jgi:hypothetical protein
MNSKLLFYITAWPRRPAMTARLVMRRAKFNCVACSILTYSFVSVACRASVRRYSWHVSYLLCICFKRQVLWRSRRAKFRRNECPLEQRFTLQEVLLDSKNYENHSTISLLQLTNNTPIVYLCLFTYTDNIVSNNFQIFLIKSVIYCEMKKVENLLKKFDSFVYSDMLSNNDNIILLKYLKKFSKWTNERIILLNIYDLLFRLLLSKIRLLFTWNVYDIS